MKKFLFISFLSFFCGRQIKFFERKSSEGLGDAEIAAAALNAESDGAAANDLSINMRFILFNDFLCAARKLTRINVI